MKKFAYILPIFCAIAVTILLALLLLIYNEEQPKLDITDLELSVTKIDFKSEEGKNCIPSKRTDNKRSKPRSICCIVPSERGLQKIFYNKDKYNKHFNISITKMATNAFAVWTINDKQLNAELDMTAWLEFVRDLHVLVSEWEKEYDECGITACARTFSESSCIKKWSLDIHSSDKNEPNTFRGIESYPPNWDEFKKIMDDMAAKIEDGA